MGKLIGIDLGTANTEICMKGSGIVLRAPSVVAVREDTGEVVAVGHEAKKMIGKTSGAIRVERPLRNGVITDMETATKMLRAFLMQIEARTLFSRPDVYVCTPCGINGVERNAVETVLYEAGARTARLIEEPLASAIGSGISIARSRGSMIVDIGGGTTEVAVLCSQGIAETKTIRVAGDAMDEAVMKYLHYEKGILVGENTAEEVKIKVGTVHPDVVSRPPFTVYGRSVRSNMAAGVSVGGAELARGLKMQVRQIIAAILSTLENTPPELSSDVYENGIMLTGGTSQLGGMARLIYETTGIRVRTARYPMDTVCIGLSRILESETAETPSGILLNRPQRGTGHQTAPRPNSTTPRPNSTAPRPNTTPPHSNSGREGGPGYERSHPPYRGTGHQTAPQPRPNRTVRKKS